MLPEPTSERFKPLRSGLINLYKFEVQEFWFECGRLLLHGNNGTGKSRVLALQLPFLFDGEISSHRVEPDGDPARTIAWHLLMNEYEDRLGYTWIEFGRRKVDGSSEFVTLGCGMRAVRGVSGLSDRWYFATHKRVGRDFSLLTDHRQPLSRDQLQFALDQMSIFGKVEPYRRRVDELLFGLNLRYDSLIELLIRLRAPQLARKLDEDRLSGALTDALPPLGENLVKDVAESFRNLDSIRAELQTLRDIHVEVDRFLEVYQRYLQVAARRRAELVRTQHSRYEDTQRGINEQNRLKDQAEAASRRPKARSPRHISTSSKRRHSCRLSVTALTNGTQLHSKMREPRPTGGERSSTNARLIGDRVPHNWLKPMPRSQRGAPAIKNYGRMWQRSRGTLAQRRRRRSSLRITNVVSLVRTTGPQRQDGSSSRKRPWKYLCGSGTVPSLTLNDCTTRAGARKTSCYTPRNARTRRSFECPRSARASACSLRS